MAESTARIADLERVQSELQQRQREIVEAQYLRRADTIDQIADAVRRLGELGSPAGILARAAAEIGAASLFDGVLISEVRAQTLVPLRIWARDDNRSAQLALATLRASAPIKLEYPLLEEEAIIAREPRVAEVSASGARTPAALTAALAWRQYVVSPIIVEGVVIGTLHADAHDRELDALDVEVATIACTALGEVFDRAVLRETLQRHRAELQSAVSWIGGRLRGLAADDGRGTPVPGGPHEADTIEALTPREQEIITLMARGQTNAAIAATLVVREGTVKYHVKNVLRKLNARSRADAVAKYMRATGALP